MRKRLLVLLFVGAAALGCTPTDQGASPDLTSPAVETPGTSPSLESPSGSPMDDMSPSPSAS